MIYKLINQEKLLIFINDFKNLYNLYSKLKFEIINKYENKLFLNTI